MGFGVIQNYHYNKEPLNFYTRGPIKKSPTHTARGPNPSEQRETHSVFGFRGSGLGLRARGLGFRARGLGLRARGLGFRFRV